MKYKIMKLANSISVEYWQFVTNADGTEYVAEDLVALEVKMIEILKDIPISKLKVVSELAVTEDLNFL